MNLTADQLAQYFDHTQLKAYATKADFEKLCEESRKYHFRMVAINPAPVSLCKQLLQGTDIHVGAAIGFPLGQTSLESKLAETIESIASGADEIDYVINVGRLKDKQYDYITKEMATIVDACRKRGVTSKVIFENCYLTDDEKLTMCSIAREVRPDFIKTSTGFGTGGATEADIRLMVENTKGLVKVKAAGGIRTLDDAMRMIDLGVSRIGSTASVKILEEYLQKA